jgi:hypothetical protein
MEWLRQLFARGLVENTVKIFFIVCILITMQNSKRKRKRKRNRNRNLSEHPTITFTEVGGIS